MSPFGGARIVPPLVVRVPKAVCRTGRYSAKTACTPVAGGGTSAISRGATEQASQPDGDEVCQRGRGTACQQRAEAGAHGGGAQDDASGAADRKERERRRHRAGEKGVGEQP